MTYDNPVYIEQKNRRHENINETGFIVPKKLSESDEIDSDNEDVEGVEEIIIGLDSSNDNLDNWKNFDVDDENGENNMISLKKNKPIETSPQEEKAIEDFISNFDEVSGEYKPKQEMPEIKIPSAIPEIKEQPTNVVEQPIKTVPVKEVKTIKFSLPKE